MRRLLQSATVHGDAQATIIIIIAVKQDFDEFCCKALEVNGIKPVVVGFIRIIAYRVLTLNSMVKTHSQIATKQTFHFVGKPANPLHAPFANLWLSRRYQDDWHLKSVRSWTNQRPNED